jgi:hypothetical protein
VVYNVVEEVITQGQQPIHKSEERKMNEKQIIQGLKMCRKEGGCANCPYYKYTLNCQEHLASDALDLIMSLKTNTDKNREHSDE